MIRGMLDLYEASLDEQWLEWAVKLQATLDELLWDKEGVGYFMVTPGDPTILVSVKEGLKVFFLYTFKGNVRFVYVVVQFYPWFKFYFLSIGVCRIMSLKQ